MGSVAPEPNPRLNDCPKVPHVVDAPVVGISLSLDLRDQLHQRACKGWPDAKEDPVLNLSRTFPPDNCSLSAICLRLPSLMSGTLCHLSQPCRERSQAAKSDDSTVHIFTCSDDEPTAANYSLLLTPSWHRGTRPGLKGHPNCSYITSGQL